MIRALSLAHLTVLDLPPPRMIESAARIGYTSVGLRLIAINDTTPGYPLMHDPAMLRATKAALAATGLTVNDIEFVRLTPEFDPAALEPFLAAGAELGARHLIAAPYDPDLARLSDRLAGLTDLASGIGIRPVLEFFPWTVIPDLASARRIVQATGRPEAGILLDMLHFDRSGSRLAEIDATPAGRLPFIHLCDAPVQPTYTTEELLHTARSERRPPGEGAINLGAILDRLPKDIPMSLEVPMSARQKAEGSVAVARAIFDKTQSFFAAR